MILRPTDIERADGDVPEISNERRPSVEWFRNATTKRPGKSDDTPGREREREDPPTVAGSGARSTGTLVRDAKSIRAFAKARGGEFVTRTRIRCSGR